MSERTAYAQATSDDIRLQKIKLFRKTDGAPTGFRIELVLGTIGQALGVVFDEVM